MKLNHYLAQSYRLKKTIERKSSTVQIFAHKTNQSGFKVQITSTDGKHQTIFHAMTFNSELFVDAMVTIGTYEYGLPKFIQKLITEISSKSKDTIFNDLNVASANMVESKDCAVKALAVVASITYEQAHKICAANGRPKRAGMKLYMIRAALKDAGMIIIEELDRWHFRSGSSLCMLANKHGVKRFTWNSVVKALDPNKRYLISSHNHVAGVINGKVEDYGQTGRRLVTEIIEVA